MSRQPEQPELGEVGPRPGDGVERSFGGRALAGHGERRAEPEIADARIRALLKRRTIELGRLCKLAIAIISVTHAERGGRIAGERSPAALSQRGAIVGGTAR